MTTGFARTVTLAFTGASGMPYGVRMLQCLLAAGARVYLLYSAAAQIVAKQECDLVLPAQPREAERRLGEQFAARPGQLLVFGREDWMAPIASGSNPADAMIVCPATMGSVAAIAHGLADNLIERAADVMLKERRPLVLVPRETPLSLIHLENLAALARAGAVILPPSPGFYHRPQSVAELVDFVVARALDLCAIPHDLQQRWGPRGSRRRRGRTSSDPTVRIPLFPLHTVLFPGGLLPLKVFEQRYVEMTKACLRDAAPFGVCLIRQGSEVAREGDGAPVVADVGTLAHIDDWAMPQLGILQLATRGGTRFRVTHSEQAPSGLLVADVVPIAAEPRLALTAAQAPLRSLLELVAQRLPAEHFPRDADYEDASFVGYRLAECLPLPLAIKQSMLEINDAGVRLSVLQRFLQEQGVLGAKDG